MKITKFGHSCLLLEEGSLRAVIDPGIYATGQNELTNVDVVLITHEHPDHMDVTSVKTIVQNNPAVKIYSNENVVVILAKEGIIAQAVKGGDFFEEKGVSIEVYGDYHAIKHISIPPILNRGYFIAKKFFYPGDMLIQLDTNVSILALPITAQWAKMSEIFDYALAINPEICIPVHDSILQSNKATYEIAHQILTSKGIRFLVPDISKPYEF